MHCCREKEYQLVTLAANRWTDNIFECKSFLVKKKGYTKKDAERLLGIGSNFDCKCDNIAVDDVVQKVLGRETLQLAYFF